jgi:hypothetical protein
VFLLPVTEISSAANPCVIHSRFESRGVPRGASVGSHRHVGRSAESRANEGDWMQSLACSGPRPVPFPLRRRFQSRAVSGASSVPFQCAVR